MRSANRGLWSVGLFVRYIGSGGEGDMFGLVDSRLWTEEVVVCLVVR